MTGIQLTGQSTLNTGIGNDTVTGDCQRIGIDLDGEDVKLLTGQGDDLIVGHGQENMGISLRGNSRISTGEDNDTIIGEGDTYGIYINDNVSILYTGSGDDSIEASAGIDGYGILSYGIINTGIGDDSIVSEGGRVGIINYNIIRTGDGNDLIHGVGIVGINHTGIINTGNGDDLVIGEGEADGFGFEIYDGGTIHTGAGNDQVIGQGIDPFTGFNGGGSIKLGGGDDLIKGFGQVTVDGQSGFDRAQFDFDRDTVEFGITDNIVVITYNEIDMTLANIESFEFSGGTDVVPFSELAASEFI